MNGHWTNEISALAVRRSAGRSAQKEKARRLCLDCLTLKLSNGKCLCGDKTDARDVVGHVNGCRIPALHGAR